MTVFYALAYVGAIFAAGAAGALALIVLQHRVKLPGRPFRRLGNWLMRLADRAAGLRRDGSWWDGHPTQQRPEWEEKAEAESR